MKLNKILMLFATALLFYGCGSSPEKQQQNWERNKANVEKLSTTYANFAEFIAKQTAKAEAEMTEALKVTDAKEQTAAMRSANQTLWQGVTGSLRKVDSLIDELKSKSISVPRMAKSNADSISVKQAVELANQALLRVEKSIREPIANEQQAISILSQATRDLESALKPIRDLESAFRRSEGETGARQRETSETPKVGTQPGTTTNNETQTQPSATLWKCEYCGSMSKETVTKCENCGASRTK